MRWRGATREPAAEDYGLLVPAATAPNAGAADEVRDLLRSHGIRATTGRAYRHGSRYRTRVLVFPEDAARAYDVICDHTG
ncbi:ethanolamine ammonia-lyase small subunit [Nocardia transvalensis]|uniref:Ethanolamine ammonia-lyase small subunit n=1 Tax=Nocardia transvalensis TaxID=37333 RepID=A0A7W9PJX7_9NOCA|nr:hypothetical protein [Nocardia transvalensis]MBB5917529.1 ethanolamine ammonia-lyase small subunit [Nocardia transvalensis]